MRNPENVIVIENHGDHVLINASEDNFSTRRKLFFIRHLAAEGYIPGRFERIAFAEVEDSPELIWRVDEATGRKRATRSRVSDRLMFRLFGLSLLLWLILTALAYRRVPFQGP
jgi:hypothetical protein